MSEKVLIVIPARIGSTRFPGKPKAIISGQSMIERVWRIAKAVPLADEVLIATDSEEIKAFSESFGANAVMTSESCRTGTDRVAETAQVFGDAFGVIVSFQGDSLLTPPWVIDDVVRVVKEDKKVELATPAVSIEGKALKELVAQKAKGSTTGTTVVFDKNYNALYFSKSLLPFPRDGADALSVVYKHIGLYVYRRKLLERLHELPQSELERVEKLEQLRALENGISIRVVVVDYKGRSAASVDCPEDVGIVEGIIKREGELIS